MIKEIKSAWWDYFSILGSQAIALPLSLIYISLIARLFGPEKWGIVTLFMGIVQLLFASGISWTSGSIIRFGKEEFIKQGHLRKTVSARVFIFVICSVILFSVSFALRKTITGYIGLPERDFGLIFAMVVVYAAADHLTWTLKAAGGMKRFAMSSAIRQFALIVFILTLFILPIARSVYTIINFEIFSYLAVIIFSLFSLKFSYYFPLELDFARVKDILVYSWPSAFIFLLGYASSWMHIYFINYFLAPYYVGMYQVAYRLMEYISTPLMAVTFLGFPLLMSVKAQGRQDLILLYIKRITPQVALFWGIVISAIMVVSNFIIGLLFGNVFAEAAMPFLILLLGLGFQVLSTMYTSIFAIFDWLVYNLVIMLIMCIINFFGDFMLIPVLGIKGAAVATSVSYAVAAVLYLFIANKLMSLRANSALSYPVLPVLSFLACLTVRQVYLRALIVAGLILMFIFISKQKKAFAQNDTAFLEKIEMPHFLKGWIRRVYLFLS